MSRGEAFTVSDTAIKIEKQDLEEIISDICCTALLSSLIVEAMSKVQRGKKELLSHVCTISEQLSRLQQHALS